MPEKNEVDLLNKAFLSFNAASKSLVRYYRGLEERIKELDIELEEKNRALISSLHERDRMKNYLGSILQSLNVGVVTMDLKGKITLFNRAAEKITGYKLNEVIGRGIKDLFAPSLEANYQHLPEVNWVRRDGERMVLSLSLSDIADFQGGLAGSVLLINDITEVSRFREQVKRNSRLTAMGEMSVRIAHDLRNPLGSIELFSSILKKELRDDRDKIGILDHISLGVKTMDRLISNLLFFTRPQRPIFKKADINKVIKDSILFSTHLISNHNIEVEERLFSNGMEISCDEELMKQVFLNLILNAAQAMPKGGRLIIDLERRRENGWISISITDTGVGICREDLEKIFDPFFTTKERGTGLGLAIVHNIVHAHDGTIEVDSYPNKGSRFTIRLPITGRQRPMEVSCHGNKTYSYSR